MKIRFILYIYIFFLLKTALLLQKGSTNKVLFLKSYKHPKKHLVKIVCRQFLQYFFDQYLNLFIILYVQLSLIYTISILLLNIVFFIN